MTIMRANSENNANRPVDPDDSQSVYRHDARPPCTSGYLVPIVLQACRAAGARRVLDLGSGNGTLCRALAEAGFAVVGLEPSASGIEAARRAVPAGTFHRGSVYDGPEGIPESDFDVVVSTEVVEHLFRPAALPALAFAKLKPGGRFVVSTPYHGYLKNLLLALANCWDSHHAPGWDGGHVKFWYRRTLTTLLEAQGFRVLEFRGAGRFPWLWKSMVLVAEKASGSRA